MVIYFYREWVKILFFMLIFLPVANAATTMNFDGTLIDTPCRID